MKTEWKKWKEEDKVLYEVNLENKREKKLIGKEKTSYEWKMVGMFLLGFFGVASVAASFAYPALGLIVSPALVLIPIILSLTAVAIFIAISLISDNLSKQKIRIKRREDSLTGMKIHNPYSDYSLKSKMGLEYKDETILHPYGAFYPAQTPSVPTMTITTPEGKTHEENIFKSKIT